MTNAGERVHHVGHELEQLGLHFNKKFAITPTLNRKSIATQLAKTGTDKEIRAAASHMTHSVSVHQNAYQHACGADDTVNR